MTPDEIEPAYDGRFDLIDAESEDISDAKNMRLRINRSMQLAYEEAMNDFVAEIRSYCTSRGADFISVRTDEPIEKVLLGELLKVGVMA